MGFESMVPGIVEGTVDENNQCEVYPSLVSIRAGLFETDPGALGRKIDTWPNFGEAAPLGGANVFGGFSATYDGVYSVFGWNITFNVGGNPGYIDNWLAGGEEDVLQAASSYGVDLAAIKGNDVDVPIRFWASDTHENLAETPALAAVLWGAAQQPGYPPPPQDEGVIFYRTRAKAAILPALTPSVQGDTFLTFNFSITPNTRDGTGVLYLRWKKCVNAVAENFDGEVVVAQGVKGEAPLSFQTSLTDLEPDQDYSFWLFLERSTNGLAETTGEIATKRTNPLGEIDFGSGAVDYDATPTTCRFSWRIPVERARGVRELPASQVEVMEKAEFDELGWVEEKTLYTGISPAFTLDTSRNRYFKAPGETGLGEVLGNGRVTGLTAAREYVFRVRLDVPSGALYPVSGVFRTLDYNSARPEAVPALGML